ncbi:magnesium/cobalt transporter CorA [Helicobacter sp. MIT 14-3879]|uniref:magnesium/cobalt transporter CorA n=1 Tax=Helicobacter sp. MIT 14-3879 TaxID=2040649 RepID=UPI000E1E3FBE|nr:magnesium/cobalt transporter CorA [Helicobacter sp. MIT 14-3879]RDU62881.1 magnesium and cobalt transport protein CorA [Helicobacter sp. MIT 14-3879]
MVSIFAKQNSLVIKQTYNEGEDIASKSILWLDLLNPTIDEIAHISKIYDIEIPNKEEREEIESSARYWEDKDSITINTRFLIKLGEESLKDETITFLLCKNMLFTIRYSEFKIFDEIQQRVLASPRYFEDGFDLISKIFEVRVEKDADIIENFTRDIRELRKGVFENIYDYNEVLGYLSNLQDVNTRLRDSLFDKRRALTALLSSNKLDFDVKSSITTIVKDLNSLIDFCVANMNALDNIHALFASQINIEQNKIIKIFTVVTVAMMPPTLIGTIYGMNFTHMPELDFTYSYPIVLLVMIISTIIPIVYFKKKGWL